MRWFERRRARALATGSLGFAAGGLAVPVVVWSMNTHGWQTTAAVSGVAAGIAVYLFAAYLDGYPSDYGQEVDGMPPEAADDVPTAEGLTSIHFTAQEAVKTVPLDDFFMSALFVVGAVPAHLALFPHENILTPTSFVGAALPVMQIVGMAIGGTLGDRINKRLIASVAMFGRWRNSDPRIQPSAWMIALFVIFTVWHGARGPVCRP